MSPSIWQLLIVAAVALLLFGGRGRISSIMGDMAKGITSFRKGVTRMKIQNPSKATIWSISLPKRKRPRNQKIKRLLSRRKA